MTRHGGGTARTLRLRRTRTGTASLAKETGTTYEKWDQVPRPQFEERFRKPILWKRYIDFLGWRTARYFARAEKGGSVMYRTVPRRGM